jgi:N-acetylmuramoyl-L-alanine amidase
MRKKILYIIVFLVGLFLPATILAEPPSKKFVVVIDAGHGAHDAGAVNRRLKIKEKDINLKTALKLGEMIEKNCPDVKVVYTRKKDVFVELHRRAQIANNAKADLFISIHTNSVAKGTVRGAETYTLGMARAEENLAEAKRENEVILLESNYQTTYKGFNPNSSESYIIFEFMQDANMSQSVSFAKKVQSQFRNNSKRIDKGVKQAGFLVLRETSMPSVLIELGFISTDDEAQYLISEKGSSSMAQSIYRAFVSYKNGRSNEHSPATPAVVEPEPEPEPEPSQPEVEKPATPAPATAPATQEAPVFKIQILTSDRPLKNGDARFKGLKNIENYKEGNIYKYTYAASTNYNEVLRKKKEITSKFKDCFIIAFRNGVKMDVNEAIRLYKTNKK